MSAPVISVENLGKDYVLSHQTGESGYRTLRDTLGNLFRHRRSKISNQQSEIFRALHDVSFEVQPGEVLGIIGRNGAGKSTLLKILSRITEPTRGRVRLRGRMASLLEVGTGFHPELTGRENIFLNGAILGMTRAEIRKKFDEIVDFSGVEKFLDTPVKRYSSGMYVRLAFAVAAHLDPDILIIDEVLAVGDQEFQRKCLQKMREVSSSDGRTVLFVSHNLTAIRLLCQRGLLLQQGMLVRQDSIHQVIECYHHLEAPLPGRHHAAAGARITHVRFVDSSGRPACSLGRQDHAIFRMEITTARKIEKPLVSIAIMHGTQQAVFSEFRAFPDAWHAGTHTIEGRFPAACLKNESYFLTAYLYEGETELDRTNGHALPEIVDPSADPFIESRRWGLVRVPVDWTLKA